MDSRREVSVDEHCDVTRGDSPRIDSANVSTRNDDSFGLVDPSICFVLCFIYVVLRDIFKHGKELVFFIKLYFSIINNILVTQNRQPKALLFKA